MTTIRLALIFLLCGSIGVVKAEKMPSAKQILETTELVNLHFIVENDNPTLPSNVGKERPSNIWTRGVYYEGLMALNAVAPKPLYTYYATRWAKFHYWNFRSGNATRNADDLCCAQTYVDLYRLQPEEKRIDNVYTALEGMAYSAKDDDWTWIDAVQMAMPVFAKMGALKQDMAYLNKMMEQYRHTRNSEGGTGLFNVQEGLWWRDKDFIPPYKEPNGANCYWSRGNGWVYAAIVRVVNELSAAQKNATPADKEVLAGMINELKIDFLLMSDALRRCQRPDGFWNVSLHDGGHFGGKETTGTALFVYGMAWGIRKGWLDKKVYSYNAICGWNAMANDAVHPDGFLGYVQGTGKEPKDGQPVTFDSKPDFEDYGVGCFLLAGSEMYNLAKKRKL